MADPTSATPAPTASDRRRHRTHEMPGRPYRLSVRLSEAERQVIVDAAIAARLTPAGYAAKAAVAVANGQVAPSAGFTDTLRDLQRELFAARRLVNLFASNVNQAAAAYHSTGQVPVWVGEATVLSRTAISRLDEVTARIDRRLR